jgi:DNA-binding transcriptional LysR family regulator
VELRHLRYFVAVAESLHFGRAAANLRIAQPSLSHQIKQLETAVQTALLRRTKRRVELTEAGRVFFEEARDIIARADRAAMIARRTGHGAEGRLRIGVGYCMDQSRISEAASRFNERFPAVRVELQTIAVPVQFTALRDRTLDVGFVRPPVAEPVLASEMLMREPLFAALPATHRLAARHGIPLSALANEPFILPSRGAVPVYHDIVLKACRDAGFVPHSPHEADQLQMVLAMVTGRSGVALVPAFARRLRPPGVAFVSVAPPPLHVDLALAWRRDDTSPMVPEFITLARQFLAPRQAAATGRRLTRTQRRSASSTPATGRGQSRTSQ